MHKKLPPNVGWQGNPFTRGFRVLFCKLVEKNFMKILPFLGSYFSDKLTRLTRKFVMKRILDYGLWISIHYLGVNKDLTGPFCSLPFCSSDFRKTCLQSLTTFVYWLYKVSIHFPSLCIQLRSLKKSWKCILETWTHIFPRMSVTLFSVRVYWILREIVMWIVL